MDYMCYIWYSVLFSNIILLVLNTINFSKIRKKKIIYSPDVEEWMDITKNPIPDEGWILIFISDGDKVDTCLRINYDKNGNAVMSSTYDRKPIKYWRPYPEPPKK